MCDEVFVIQYNDRPLGAYPKKYVDRVVKKLSDDGVKFCFNESAVKIEKVGEIFKVTLKGGAAFYGSEAAYLVNFVTFIINCKITGEQLDKMIFAFPNQTYELCMLLIPMMSGQKLM